MNREIKKPIIWKGVLFDSNEEMFFAMWLQELKTYGYVTEWKKNQESIDITKGTKLYYIKYTQLKTKLKKEEKAFTLLRPSEYTCDFEILWTLEGMNKFLFQISENQRETVTKHIEKRGGITNPTEALFFSAEYNTTFVEVKPDFDQNNMERAFVLNQKFIWDKYKIFVNLIEPVELFKKTFLPLAVVPYFQYKVVPKKAQLKGKIKGSWKMDWIPKTITEYLNK